MDGHQFDALLRAFTNSRRSLLASITGAAGALAGVSFIDARKRKKKRKKKCNKRCRKRRKANKGKCAGGQKLCGGTCIPADRCCTNADCDNSNRCKPSTCSAGQTCAQSQLADGASCGGPNQCRDGTCIAPPICKGPRTPCSLDSECCSRNCLQGDNACRPTSANVGYCRTTADCETPAEAGIVLACVAFRCVQVPG